MMWLLKKLLQLIWCIIVVIVPVGVVIPILMICVCGIVAMIPIGIMLLPLIFFGSWLVNKIK